MRCSRRVCVRRAIRMGNLNGWMRALLYLFLMLTVIVRLRICDAADSSDTLSLGSSLRGNQTIKSKNGTFELGFFEPNGTNKWYIAMWYAQVSEKTIVWVANREKPVEKAPGVFNLTEDGNLVLFDAEGSRIWSSNATKKASAAVLQDSGNFVLTAENSSESVWQSFDLPGNTWLPGMKISVKQKLTSWKNSWDPTPGPFSLQMDRSGATQFVLLWKNSKQYWESGDWNGQIFSNVPEMTANYIYDFSFNDTVREDMYFTYSVKPQFKLISRFVLDKAGEIRQYTWLDGNRWNMFWSQPRDQCDVYDVCGPYGMCNQNNIQFCNCMQGFQPSDGKAWASQEWTGGCVRKTRLNCDSRNGSTDGFVELNGKSLPDNPISYEGYTRQRCEAACLKNCSCTAFAYNQTCQMWAGELLNVRDDSNDDQSLFIRLALSELPKSSTHRRRIVLGTLIGVVGGVASIAAVLFVIFLCYSRRRLPGKSAEYIPESLTTFTYRELQNATKNFCHRLGGGGFGSVFKGTLQDNTIVAVKKLEGLSQGEKQFRMEVSTIGTIQHVNLVRLRGFCSEGLKRLLVYEYMPNGSLNSFLFHKSSSNEHKVLDWNTRFRIALGTARGIVYLHEKCRDCIIHCDIKPENILLDANFCPKVADFGLAKLVGREFSHVLTTMRGTRGYLAPEWISGLPITPKADVYSFGMTLLEIIAGRRNLDGGTDSSKSFFPTWAATKISTGNPMDLLDEKLNKNADVEEVRRAAMVAGWCIQDDEDARPSMSQVVQILEGVLDADVPPLPMSLQAFGEQGQSGDVVFYWEKEATQKQFSHSTHVN